MSRLLSTLLVQLRQAAQPGSDRASDAEVLARFIRDRDAAAFELLYWRHGPMIWGVCRRLLGDSPDAEDAYQAAFVVLARKAAAVGRGEALAGWLHRVAWRTALNARTARRRRSAHEQPLTGLEELPDRDDPARRTADEEQKSLLDQELEKLPEKFRLPIVLCDLEGLSNEEAAAVLACPLGTLNSRLARGRQKLKDRLLRRGVSAASAPPAAVSAAALDAVLRAPSESVRALADAAIRSLATSAVKKVAAGVLLCVVLCAGLAAAAFQAKENAGGRPSPSRTDAPPPRPIKDLDPEAVIVGKVVDEAGKPVAGATVTAVGEAKSQPATSAVDGGFRLSLGRPAAKGISATLLARGRNGGLGFLAFGQEKPAPVQVVVKPPHELTVDVTDGDKKPAAGAEVFFLANYRRLFAGRTDAVGRWTGRVPADASEWAVVARKSKVGFDYVRAKESPKPSPLPGRVRLLLDGARTLRVKTVDEHGKPIAGVKVGPLSLHKPDREEDVNERLNLSGTVEDWPATGADGVVVLDWLPARFGYGFQIMPASKDRYARDRGVLITRDKPVEAVTISLLPKERLSGRVTHADGRPASGIEVRAAGRGAGSNGFWGLTRTDADGRYTFQAFSEQAYIVAVVADKQFAAPYRGGFLVRAGKPVDGVDFVLGRSTLVRGRVTVGKAGRPAADTFLRAEIDRGEIPAPLRQKGDRIYHGVSMSFDARTDKDGRFAFLLGPGQYQLHGPVRTKPAPVTIPAKNAPAEIVRDFQMPREETGPLAGQVIDGDGRPVGGAAVNGRYASQEARRWFRQVKTDDKGRFNVERSLDPLLLQARSPDGKQVGLKWVAADAAKTEIVVRPVARASGRLFDLEGKPLARTKLGYGIRVYLDPEERYSTSCFGGTATTDGEGRFTLTELIPGQKYHVTLVVGEEYRPVTEVTAKGPAPIDLGDVRVDPNPSKPYVPPTPAERTARAFAPGKAASPRERRKRILTEARREYTRPMLLFGRPKDPACIELYRLFDEEEDSDAKKDAGKVKPRPSPSKLRWEFDLASLDTDQEEVRKFAAELGLAAAKGQPPILVVLDADGSLAANHALTLDKKQKLDSQSLAAFLLKHKLPTRNAEKMLAEALKKAKSEDKRVFFITSASWCGPCRLLSRFLDARKKELERHYVFVKVDVSRDEHADALRKRYQGDNDGGVPWYAILDADGKALVLSNTPEEKRRGKPANIGFPSSPAGVEHFVKMLEQTAPRLAKEALTELRKALAEKK